VRELPRHQVRLEREQRRWEGVGDQLAHRHRAPVVGLVELFLGGHVHHRHVGDAADREQGDDGEQLGH